MMKRESKRETKKQARAANKMRPKWFQLDANGHTDTRTDGRTDGPSYRDARTHLKNNYQRPRVAIFHRRVWAGWPECG